MSTSSTSLEHEAHEHGHELELHVRVTRARVCVIMFIISDALSIVAILAAGGYLNALNTGGLFAASNDYGTAFVPSLVVAFALVLSGITWYFWERNLRQRGGVSQQPMIIVTCVLMLAALVIQVVLGVTTRYANMPYNAYESLILLLTWYTAAHLVLTMIVGLLVLGRAWRGRLVGYDYLATAAGYWWYYTIVASIIMWLFGILMK